jgi:hypothetical protein
MCEEEKESMKGKYEFRSLLISLLYVDDDFRHILRLIMLNLVLMKVALREKDLQWLIHYRSNLGDDFRHLLV